MIIRENKIAGNFMILNKATVLHAAEDHLAEDIDRLIALRTKRMLAVGYIRIKGTSRDFFIRVANPA